MVKVEVVLSVDDLENVLYCISGLEISILNFYEINSIGNNIQKPTIYRGVSQSSSYAQKTKLEILTSTDQVGELKGCIEKLIRDNSKIKPVEFYITQVNEVFQIP